MTHKLRKYLYHCQNIEIVSKYLHIRVRKLSDQSIACYSVLLSISKKNGVGCIANNSRMKAASDRQFSLFEREHFDVSIHVKSNISSTGQYSADIFKTIPWKIFSFDVESKGNHMIEKMKLFRSTQGRHFYLVVGV